jgi:hypothetical protein
MRLPRRDRPRAVRRNHAGGNTLDGFALLHGCNGLLKLRTQYVL